MADISKNNVWARPTVAVSVCSSEMMKGFAGAIMVLLSWKLPTANNRAVTSQAVLVVLFFGEVNEASSAITTPKSIEVVTP
ncbi:hypothetical protein [Arthrobacter sp. ERGS1:01]|uniref:hypothetical protein n=1 Tax=Arthrobacter sp. ERGS1:01 TaxID=1704044 RepID=UPI001ED9C14F|nr:hypothetical protein [Arthrobacter sp. ERGS1:01]